MDIRKIREELPELAFLIWHVQGEEGCGLASSLSSRVQMKDPEVVRNINANMEDVRTRQIEK